MRSQATLADERQGRDPFGPDGSRGEVKGEAAAAGLEEDQWKQNPGASATSTEQAVPLRRDRLAL